ncbi:RelA/SpoT domain-containing protein [Myroides odoratimimus]|uniref:RelA/SpoT domain-containing protein n=1 Tax=Myroides odoratimimus TaxID=76832 RepID=UPI0025772446|nr:RelA/SpoT domain-containing protein [Myroides odoratimimus]MDM1496045.1 RelA/SpoT domain-containing protein [Myroides odoratimimus]
MSFSRKEITKAGDTLLSSKSDEEFEKALQKINIWRSNHIYPMTVMKKSIIKTLDKNNIKPILVSQRLKRLTSIIYKLDLNPKMGLGGMQDIGGYRVILKDVKDLNKLKDVIFNLTTKHKLEKTNDYVDRPKSTGYRSVHFIYKYHSSSPKYLGLRIELQIRTKLQHNWATAVETAGLATNTSLKSNQGSDKWLNFFKVVSSLFAIKEGLKVLEEHNDISMEQLMIQCYHYIEELKVIDTLKALRVSTNHLESKKFPGDYYLIYIDIKAQKVKITVYKNSELPQANKEYIDIEKQILNGESAVVLVSASSVRNLKKAYPSYFLDTSEFLSALEGIRQNCISKGFV